MKKLIKTFGLIAIAAVIGFMAACNDSFKDNNGQNGKENNADNNNSGSNNENENDNKSGTYSIVAYSTDGIKWTKVKDNKFKNEIVTEIAYGNGTWLAATTGLKGSSMAYSTDGVTWNAVSDDLFESGNDRFSIYDIAWGNGKFVIVGYQGRIAYSTNCINWTEVTDTTFGISNKDGITSVKWGGDKFIAIGTKNNRTNYAYSTDGVTWTAGKSVIPNGIDTIIWGNGIWIALHLGTGTLEESYYSIDGGDTWISSPYKIDPLNVPVFISQIDDITYGNDKFVAAGKKYYGNFRYKPTIFYSPDGKDWIAAEDSISAFSNSKSYYITWGNNKFVALCSDGKIAHSPDGVIWTVENNSDFGNGDDIKDLAWGGGKFIAVGYNLTYYDFNQ